LGCNLSVGKKGVEASTILWGQEVGSGNSKGITQEKCTSFDDIGKSDIGNSYAGCVVTSRGSYPKKDSEEWAQTAGKPPIIDYIQNLISFLTVKNASLPWLNNPLFYGVIWYFQEWNNDATAKENPIECSH